MDGDEAALVGDMFGFKTYIVTIQPPYLKFSWLVCLVEIDKLARRARTQIPTEQIKHLYFKNRLNNTSKKIRIFPA